MTTIPLKDWSEVAPQLVDVAAGRRPAEMVIRGGRLVSVQTREILDGWEVAIACGRFAYVGPDASHAIGIGLNGHDGFSWRP